MNSKLRIPLTRWAALIVLCSFAFAHGTAAQTPGPGKLRVSFTAIQKTNLSEGLDLHLQQLTVIAPSGERAQVHSITWPDAATPPPTEVRRLRISLVQGKDPDGTLPELEEAERAERIFRSCEQKALLLQVKPGYRLDIDLTVQGDLETFHPFGANGDWNLILPGNRVSCALATLN